MSIAIQVARIVGQIHDRGVVHRDLRPDNILIEPASGKVKITGFGRAARIGAGAGSTVPTGPASSAYMAPEQTGRLERAADHRSDLYSIGVIMFEMLTGQLPFGVRDPAGWVYAVLARRPESPGEVRPEIPPGVSAIVMRLLSKSPEERYQGAHGLLWDLEEARRRFSQAGVIEPFPLGSRDIPARLCLPRKLFGRRRESDALAAAFEAVCSGSGGVMLVRGFAGVGKTRLVNEVLRPLALKKGFFVAGKFDQVHQNIPYAAFAQAFGNLVRQIMTEKEDRLNAWKKRISEAVGKSGGIVAAVVPELELVIGPQPPVEVLQPKEAQNRFLMVFERFVRAFAGREHPFVMFLDDLQWADPASLHFIRYLCRGSENRYLLLVAAYRDNEIDEAHPLAGTLEDIRSVGATVREVEVSPLGQREVREYIGGTLGNFGEDLADLAEVLYRKSGGNPLFLEQLTQTIYHEGLLRFRFERGRWEWDLAAIRRSPISDSTLRFLIGRLQKLPEAREAVRCGLDAGEVPVLGYAIGFIVENMYLMGRPLEEVLEEIAKADAWARRMKHVNLAANVAAYRPIISELMARRFDSATDAGAGDEPVRATRCFLKMQSCFLRGDYPGAAAAAQEIDDYTEVLMGFLISADCVLYQSLSFAALYSESMPAERVRYWGILKRNLRRMKKWSGACAANFLHKHTLIEAEMARLRRRLEEAMLLYDRSIQSAHDNGYVQNEAIASELAGRCCLAAGHRRIAAMYLENARAAYRVWGSPVKVKDLEERYPDALGAFRDLEVEVGEPGKFAGVIAGIAATAGGSSGEIDSRVVERAIRSLENETDPDRLVEGLLEVAVETAGADRGYLILERDGELFIEVAREGAQRATAVVPPLHLEKSTSLSRAMVRYSARTLESVIVNDRRDAGIFSRDQYVAKNYPKSMMCLPVLLSQIPVGVLYLENSLMTGAFTQARVEVLKLLLSQMVYVRTLQAYLESSTSGGGSDGRAALIEPLTDRESEVLSLVAAGLSNAEIAERLGMTVNTAKTHMKNIYGKLQVNRRVQAVMRGRELGVL